MDERIVRGLKALGLSEENIRKFAELIDGVKDRVREEGLITRKAQPPQVANQVTRHPAKRIRITYRPSQAPGRTVGDEIELLETRLKRDRPPWQRAQYEARLDSLRRTGKGMATLAAETLAKLQRRAR